MGFNLLPPLPKKRGRIFHQITLQVRFFFGAIFWCARGCPSFFLTSPCAHRGKLSCFFEEKGVTRLFLFFSSLIGSTRDHLGFEFDVRARRDTVTLITLITLTIQSPWTHRHDRTRPNSLSSPTLLDQHLRSGGPSSRPLAKDWAVCHVELTGRLQHIVPPISSPKTQSRHFFQGCFLEVFFCFFFAAFFWATVANRLLNGRNP